MQLVTTGLDLVRVGGVHHVDYGVDPSAVALPHGAEPRLTSNVPELDRHISLRDLPHIEAHCWYHVLRSSHQFPLYKVTTSVYLIKLSRSYHVDEGRLACVLEPDQSQLHLLLPEERLEPVQHLVDHLHHLDGLNMIY